MVKSGWFFGRPLGPLLKPGLPLMKNAIKALVKSVLVPLGLTTAAAATAALSDARIHKNILGSESFDPRVIGLGATTLIISNEELTFWKLSNLSKILVYF